ncbi:unnamed protein product [Didymodactylos carnosus]|uniref:Uncharacterized protein n=1 Tax=Didymodactylos carnosus TaxID=1234261 RepID=A0A8S2TYL7_9BILA|nr:unnamed protein product [Didymodactylos carnosus]CAF4316367.1 unnamed protein product [Didymodactylos carnosus]
MQHGINGAKFIRTLRNLSKDKSIYITRADKGRAVVILDREDYVSKMNLIINDQSTFQLEDTDPTIKQEDRLIRKLGKLKETGFINEDEYKRCRPTGSQLARIYGLPKIHKRDFPLRPILSASAREETYE